VILVRTRINYPCESFEHTQSWNIVLKLIRLRTLGEEAFGATACYPLLCSVQCTIG